MNTQDVLDLHPCFDPRTGLNVLGETEGTPFITNVWEGTPGDFVDISKNSLEPYDQVWVIFRGRFLSEKTRECACSILAAALNNTDKPDRRSITAVSRAMAYTRGGSYQAMVSQRQHAKAALKDGAKENRGKTKRRISRGLEKAVTMVLQDDLPDAHLMHIYTVANEAGIPYLQQIKIILEILG